MPLKFNGTDNYLALGPAQNFDVHAAARAMTVAAWVKPTNQNAFEVICSNGRAGNSGWYFFLQTNGDNSTSLNWGNLGASADFTVLSTFRPNGSTSWYFVAAAISPTNLHGFSIDPGGTQQTHDTANSTAVSAGSGIGTFFGMAQNGGGSPVLLLGSPLHNLAVWNYITLTDTQLAGFAMGQRTGIPKPSFYTEFPARLDASLRDQIGQPPTKFVPNGTLAGYTGVAAGPVLQPEKPRYVVPVLRRLVSPPPVATNISDTDTGTFTESSASAGVAKADTDAFTSTSNVGSLAAAASASDTGTVTATLEKDFADTDTATGTDSGTVSDAVPPPAPGAETFTLSSTSSIATALSASDTGTLAETGSAIVSSALAVSDTDSAAVTELGTNASGGIGDAFRGVSIAFGDDALATNPTWTRLDDPVGIA